MPDLDIFLDQIEEDMELFIDSGIHPDDAATIAVLLHETNYEPDFNE